MGREIERKFLVKGESWRAGTAGVLYCQGYLSMEKERAVRVRTAEGCGFLTIKRHISSRVRMEYEYEIPVDEARNILNNICIKPLIEKKRYRVGYQGNVWEIDEFLGENRSLVLAEIELEAENQSFEKPEWVGEEVTEDPRYLTISLVRHPYSTW